MSRDRRGDGVQVVGGSNTPCPTDRNPKAGLWRAANVLRSAFGEVRRRCGTRPCSRNRMCGPLPTRNSCRPLTSSSVAPARHPRP